MASRYILKIWQQARSGNAEAQITLAEAYLYGQEGMGRNLSTARRWLESAARLASPRAQQLLAQYFPQGNSGNAAIANTRKLLPENCWRDAGGERWLKALLEGNMPEAASSWEGRLAVQGLASHQADWPGQKLPPEEKRQRAQWLLLCGQPETGVWLEKAAQAETTSGLAAWLWGLYLMGGTLHPALPPRRIVSYKKAETWLSRAAEYPLPAASFALWQLSKQRNYRHRDPLKGVRHLLRAAEQGHPAACLAMADREWAAGRPQIAVRWLEKAARQGAQTARLQLDKLCQPARQIDTQLQSIAAVWESRSPSLAARLRLAACFALSEKECLRLNPDEIERSSSYLCIPQPSNREQPIRLIPIETPLQQQALQQFKALATPCPAPQDSREIKRHLRRSRENRQAAPGEL